MLPETKGCKGCGGCCGPFPTPQKELDILGVERPTHKEDGTCDYFVDGKCKIYNKRFLICRLFGAVNHPQMTCPNGCHALLPLTYLKANKILAEYRRIVK